MRFVSLSDKMKSGVMKQMMLDDQTGGDDDKHGEQLLKGNSIASKVMEEMFKRSKASVGDAEERKKRQNEELEK